jgi:mannosyltransferase OCH1-like enzyme
MIPQLVHQTWKTDTVPKEWQASVDGFRALEAEGWTYRLWTDHDNRALIQEHYPWFLAQFDAYPHGIQRADAVRYFILHRYGGVYADLDIVPKENFTAFHQTYQHAEICLPSTKEGNVFAGQHYSNCFMMSQPGAAFWPVVWERLKNPFRGRRWKRALARFHYWEVLFTTGPGVISDSVHDYEHQVVSLPAALVQPGKESDPAPVQRPESVVKLLRGESWQKGDARFWRGLGDMAHQWPWILLGVAGLLLVLTVVFGVLWRRAAARAAGVP